MTKENTGCTPVLGGVAAIITAIGGLSGLVIALREPGSDQPPNPNQSTQAEINQSNADAAWEAYYNACGGNGATSRDEFTKQFRAYFNQVWNETGARPAACG